MNIIMKISSFFYKIFIMPIKKLSCKKCGIKALIGKGSIVASYKNLEIGNYVNIGPNAIFYNTRAKILFGNKIMLGPNVTIITGNHRIDLIGKYMYDITDKEKLPENDKDVKICDDVWIGANVTILNGVTIGEGSVIGAGSVVTKDVAPYSINCGNPAKKIKDRFNKEDLESHKEFIKEEKHENKIGRNNT